MKILQFTLKALFITLIYNQLSYAEPVSEAVAACTLALNNGDVIAAEKAGAQATKLNPNHHQGLLCYGRALGAQGKYQEALSALKRGEQNAKEQFEGVISFILIGNLHKQFKHSDEAIAAYQQSIAICEASKNDKFKRINHHLMAEAFTQKGDLQNALAQNELGNKLSMNDNERADSYERLAQSHAALGQMAEAVDNQIKATVMHKKSGTLDQYATSLIELGKIHTQAKDMQSAATSYEKLVAFAQENGGEYYEAKAYLLLAQLKKSEQKQVDATTLIDKAEKIAQKIRDQELLAEISAAKNK